MSRSTHDHVVNRVSEWRFDTRFNLHSARLCFVTALLKGLIDGDVIAVTIAVCLEGKADGPDRSGRCLSVMMIFSNQLGRQKSAEQSFSTSRETRNGYLYTLLRSGASLAVAKQRSTVQAP